MSDVEILNQMIKNGVREQPQVDNYGKNRVTLTEPKQPNSSITINGLPDDAIVIKADAFTSPDGVFNGSKGECKRADYVIVADIGRKKVIVYIEMTVTSKLRKERIQQLKGAKCFVAYCQEIGKVFWNQKTFLEGCTHRFVSISHISIAKGKTRFERKNGIHDRPEKMMEISYPHHLEFNRLAGKGS